MNYVFLHGRLGADPELKYTDTGSAVCRLRVATRRAWTDSQGAKQERTDWHTVITWNKLAEICSKFLGKGRKVNVVGSIQTRSFEDKDGVNKYITEIIANEVEFVDMPSSGEGTDKPAPQKEMPRQSPPQRPRPAAKDVPFQDVSFPDGGDIFN